MPSDGRGVPLAMWIRPSRPSSRAAQPIAARTVSVFRSGCRRNRQASSAARTGRTQDSEPNPSAAAVWTARPTVLPIRAHSDAPSTMATPRVISPRPSRRWCGSRSRAPRPAARAANPTAPASSIQAAAIIRPVHWIRMTTGSLGRAAAPPLARRPFAAPPFAVPGLPPGLRLPFFFGPERAWFPRPGLRPGGWRAGDFTAGPASSGPPRGRADPLRARVAIVTNVARTPEGSKHRGCVSALLFTGLFTGGRRHPVDEGRTGAR